MMNRMRTSMLAMAVLGFCVVAAEAQDPLLVPPAPQGAVLVPPVAVGPYYAYSEPVYVAPVIVTPVYYAPVYVAPVAPVVVTDFYPPAHVAPSRVKVRSSPWSYKVEYDYGSSELEYRVDRHGRVRVEYDD